MASTEEGFVRAALVVSYVPSSPVAVNMNHDGAQGLTLQGLPDALQQQIASFCTFKTRMYCSRLSRWTLCSPAWNPPKLRLHEPGADREDELNVLPEDVLCMRRLLARGQGACTSIVLQDKRPLPARYTLEVLASAIREDAVLGRQIKEILIKEFEGDCEHTGPVSMIMLLAQLLQEDRLPCLVGLVVDCHGAYNGLEDGGAAVLCECVGRGTCPQLKHLTITWSSYHILPMLAEALELRGDKGVQLESLTIGRLGGGSFQDIAAAAPKAAFARLVRAPCLSKLKTLRLEEVVWGSWAAALYLNQTASTDHIREIALGPPDWIQDKDEEDADDDFEELVRALLAGRAPLLRELVMPQQVVIGGLLDRLCHAISHQGIFKHLERLEVDGRLEQEETRKLTVALALGCPRLRSVERCGWNPGFFRPYAPPGHNSMVAAVLAALPHPLRCHDSLTLREDAGLREVVAALRMNPHALSAMRTLNVAGLEETETNEGQEAIGNDEVVTLLGIVMEHCPCLERLAIRGSLCLALIPAMAPGGAAADGTRGLKRLSVAGVDATMRALAAGACPVLEELFCGCGLSWIATPPEEECTRETKDAIVALLTGNVACSATLRGASLDYTLDTAHVRQLTASLRQQTFVQLDCLNSLRFDCGLEDCLDLLRALALPSVGDKLSELDLECVGLTSEEREELVNEAARLIREGAWPRLVGMEPGGMWDMSIWLGGEGHAVDLEVLVYGWAENGFDQAIYDALQARRGEIETACI